MVFKLLIVTAGLWLQAAAQVAQAPAALVSGQTVEREIAGGQTHTYPIPLAAGQFLRVMAVQKGINISVALKDANGRDVAEANFSGAFGGNESLSYEATAGGEHQLQIRPVSAAAPKGSYELRLELKAAATAQDQKRIAAERLLMEAFRLNRQLAFPAAIEKAQQALPMWRELSDSQWEAETLAVLGSAHNSTRKFDQALEYYQQTLSIRQRVKDRAGEANARYDLGIVLYGMNRYEEAAASTEQALALRRELNDRAGEGNSLAHLALLCHVTRQFEKAMAYNEQALPIQLALGDRVAVGHTYVRMGSSLLDWGRNEQAIRHLEQALAIHRETKNRAGEGFTLHNLGVASLRQGQYEIAAERLEQSLAIRREVKDRLNEGGTLLTLGIVYQNLARDEKAQELYEQALAIARDLKDPVGEARALTSLARIHQQLGQFESANDSLERAILLFRSLKDRFGEAGAFVQLGQIHYLQGSYEKALSYDEHVLELNREAKDRPGQVRSFIRIGIDFYNLGRYDKAVEQYEQGLALAREIKARELEGVTLENLANARMITGRYEEAIEAHEQSLAISRETKNRGFEGRILNNLGEALKKQGRAEKAAEYFTQAIPILREAKDREGVAIALTGLGSVENAVGRAETAAGRLTEALAIAREINSPPREREALYDLARVERNRGNLARARELIEQSLRLLEASRAEIYSSQSRATYFAAAHDSQSLYIDLLMRQHQADPAQGMDRLAVEASERFRARGLLELLAEAGTNIRQGADAALLAQEEALGRRLNAKAARLAQVAAPAQAAALKQQISQLETEYERVQADIRKSSPRYASLVQPQPLTLREIQQQLDADTLLLEYSLGEERSHLWAITKDSLASYELPKQELIDRGARQVYEQLTARSARKRGETPAERRVRIAEAEAKLAATARDLSRMLLAPVTAQLGNKRLVIVADGALQYVPFAMLPEPVVGSRLSVVGNNANPPLIFGHEVVNLPSASVLAIQRAELAGRAPASKTLAVIADPVFDRGDARFASLAPRAKAEARPLSFADERSIEHLAEHAAEAPGAPVRRLVIPRLPFTRREADRLLALAPKTASLRAVDFQASRETALGAELGHYRYVHFATHGLLDAERPGLSSLALSMVDAQGRPQNGFLRANDIYNLKLPADLVVLSACQTGLGKEIKGEGLVGLTRGFMYAGAARVVVSLWSVNDQATADLMAKFYEKMLKQGERPAAALRAAQVEMRRQKQWSAPYYWAAFVLQGEWK